MVWIAVLTLSLMAIANYCLERRYLYPPVVFCAVWAADLVLIALCGDLFFPLSDKTLAFFCCGGLFFSLGSAFGLIMHGENHKHQADRAPGKILTLLSVAIVLLTPVVYFLILRLAQNFTAAT